MQQKIMIAVLVVMLSIGAYANTFGNEFVWDEKVFVQDNLQIRSLNNVPLFFLDTVDGLYRPLRTTLYALTYAVWGENTFGYHLNSIAWHALCSVMVFLIAGKLVKGNLVPAAAAAIFAVHPIHTERVTNMTGGFDLLGIFFMLAAFYCYILFRGKNRKLLFAASMALFAAALFSSEEAFTLPFLILLYEAVFRNKRLFTKNAELLYPKVLPFILLAAFALFRFFFIGLGARAVSYPTGNFITTMLTMPKVFLNYIYLSFIPHPITLYHEISPVKTLLNPFFALGVFAVAAFFIAALRYRNKIPLISFSIGWFFITLIPFSNVLPLQTLLTERYLYLPTVAASLLYALAIFKVPKSRILSGAALILLITAFMTVTIDRNSDWKDNITLWEKTAESSPKTSLVFSNLGFAYEKNNRLTDAKRALAKAIELDDSNSKAHYNLGIIYTREKNYKQASESFLAAIKNSPDYSRAYNALGMVYYYTALERPDVADVMMQQAEMSFGKAISTEPRDYKPYADLALVKAHKGKFSEAVALLEHSIEINPWNHEAYFNLGVIYEFLGDEKLARNNFAKAATLKPDNTAYSEKLALRS